MANCGSVADGIIAQKKRTWDGRQAVAVVLLQVFPTQFQLITAFSKWVWSLSCHLSI